MKYLLRKNDIILTIDRKFVYFDTKDEVNEIMVKLGLNVNEECDDIDIIPLEVDEFTDSRYINYKDIRLTKIEYPIKDSFIKTIKTDFLNLIREKVTKDNYYKPVTMVFKPSIGCNYEIIASITEIYDNDKIWISNLKDTKISMNIQNIMTILLQCDNNKEVAFKVYRHNSENNEELIIVNLDFLKIDIIETTEYIYFIIYFNNNIRI